MSVRRDSLHLGVSASRSRLRPSSRSRSAEGSHADRPCAGDRRILVGPPVPHRTARHDGAVFRLSSGWSVLRAARHGLCRARARVSHGPQVVRSLDGFVCRRACRGRPGLRNVGSPAHERCARRVLAAGGDLRRGHRQRACPEGESRGALPLVEHDGRHVRRNGRADASGTSFPQCWCFCRSICSERNRAAHGLLPRLRRCFCCCRFG